MKSYTTIEQSNKLIELGIDTKTADMIYIPSVSGDSYCESPFNYPYTPRTAEHPCWSLMALLNLLVYPTLEKVLLGSDELWFVSTYPNSCRLDSNYYSSPIDACMEMITRLKEDKYI